MQTGFQGIPFGNERGRGLFLLENGLPGAEHGQTDGASDNANQAIQQDGPQAKMLDPVMQCRNAVYQDRAADQEHGRGT